MSLLRKQIQHPPPCRCGWWEQAFSSQLLVRQQFQRRLQEWVGGTCRKISLCDICRDPRALWAVKGPCTSQCKAKRTLCWSNSWSLLQLNSLDSRMAGMVQQEPAGLWGPCPSVLARVSPTAHHCQPDPSQFNWSPTISSYTLSWSACWP